MSRPRLLARLRGSWESAFLVKGTSFGFGFILVTLVVAVGATNTGNNGLYVLLSLLLAVLVVSGISSKRNVAGLAVTLEGPEELFALEPARFALTLRNDAPRERTAILVRRGVEGGPWLFPTLAPGGRAVRQVDLVFPRRGLQTPGPLLVYSGYPIGLFRKGWRHAAGEARLVFPRPLFLPLPEPGSSRRDDDGNRADRRGRGAGIRNLREGLPGDDPRDVHWPQTARQGIPIVKERDAEESRVAVVVVDGAVEFERGVAEAAGAVLTLLDRGDRVGLLAGRLFVPPGSGAAQRRTLLGALAAAEPSARELAPLLPDDVVVYRVGRHGDGGALV